MKIRDESISGPIGACVQALDIDGVPIESGRPVICTLLDVGGDGATEGTVTTLSPSMWNKGDSDEFTPLTRGQLIKFIANFDNLKVEGRNLQDSDGWAENDAEPRSVDDGWAENARDAVYDPNTKADIQRALDPFRRSATFSWYQPAKADFYPGLRRYGATDKVQTTMVALNEELSERFELIPTTQIVTLIGATALQASLLTLVTATLAL